VKNFLGFLRVTIPILWLISVLAAFRGGFQFGYVPLPPPGQTYPYPWLGVIFVIMVTAIESVFLYFILRPHRFTWSLPRVGIALVVFCCLSLVAMFTARTDQPGYMYVPGNFTFAVTFLLFILLIITIVVIAFNRPAVNA